MNCMSPAIAGVLCLGRRQRHHLRSFSLAKHPKPLRSNRGPRPQNGITSNKGFVGLFGVVSLRVQLSVVCVSWVVLHVSCA